jgi:hypothetical protein
MIIGPIQSTIQFTIHGEEIRLEFEMIQLSTSCFRIVKPINKSRGFGVVLMNNIERIFEHVACHHENKYLVQKYIEKPFLIHKTKFDIRQYFLTVILKDSVQIWIYK